MAVFDGKLDCKNEIIIARWLFIFIFLHVLLWTIIPFLIRYTLPMDALESYAWGQTLQFGYDRNPWLVVWLTNFALAIGGRSGWLVYLFSQISVAACFLALWKLGRKFLHPLYVLAAILILEGIQYYTIAAVDFNDNVLEIGFWALITLYFYQALSKQKLWDWFLVGVFSACAMMTKYFAIMLFLPMFILLICTKEGRASFTKIGLYFGLIIFIFGVMPHFLWSLNHDMLTFKYALRRVNDTNIIWHNSPLYFFVMHIISFLPSLCLFSLLGFGRSAGVVLSERRSLASYDKIFLLLMSIGPLFCTVICAILFKFTLHTLWGTPLLSLCGLLLAAFWQPTITIKKLRRFLIAVFSVFLLIIFGYSYSLLFDGYKSSANYPGLEITKYVMEQWDMLYKIRPYYVVGDRYTAGNVAFFSAAKLHVCIIDDQINSCPNNQVLQEKGAIFVWRNDLSPNVNLLARINEIDGIVSVKLNKMPAKNFYWKRSLNKPMLNVGAVFLPVFNKL